VEGGGSGGRWGGEEEGGGKRRRGGGQREGGGGGGWGGGEGGSRLTVFRRNAPRAPPELVVLSPGRAANSWASRSTEAAPLRDSRPKAIGLSCRQFSVNRGNCVCVRTVGASPSGARIRRSRRAADTGEDWPFWGHTG